MKKLLILMLIIGVFGIGYVFGTGNTTNIPSERSLAEFGLATGVRTALALNKHLDGSEIEVSVTDGRVELRGRVPSVGHSRLAQDIAARIDGTTAVTNHLRIAQGLGGPTTPGADRSLGQRLDDLTATARIKTALALHRDIKRGEVSVSVVAGVATLTGTVPSWAARELAAKVTEDVEGVRAVVNRLNVLPGGERVQPAEPVQAPPPAQRRVADESIRLQLEAALTGHPYIEARRVHVEVRDGVVTLSGSVRSDADRDLIQKVAEDGWGVHGVVNALGLEPTPPPPVQYAPSADAARRPPFGNE